MNEVVTGRCFCGDVRFAVMGPETFACFCYCESCQRAAGAPVVAWATYDRNTFRVIEGEICWRESSRGVRRGHCPACGSALTYESERRKGEIDVTINCLDAPGVPTPRAHIWTEDKQDWLRIGDDLPVYRRFAG
jgi:hypothetical protein